MAKNSKWLPKHRLFKRKVVLTLNSFFFKNHKSKINQKNYSRKKNQNGTGGKDGVWVFFFKPKLFIVG
jgi:hypothetical protein